MPMYNFQYQNNMRIYLVLLIFLSIQWTNGYSQSIYSTKLEKEAVRKVVTDVVDWQVREYLNMDKNRIWKSVGDLSWDNGVFLSSLASWAEFDNNQSLIKWYEEVAHRNFWRPCYSDNRIYHADDIAVCLMYVTLFKKKKDDRIIHPTIARLDFIMNHPSSGGYQMGTPNCQDHWTWCDALYMAPPVFASIANISGNERMRDFMDIEYWEAHDFLYDKKDKLFFRDSSYFGKKEKNGEKVFWGRGNAWVVGGLALMIEQLPEDYPSRNRYILLFQEMMLRIAHLQDKDGYWHASLLDPGSYPSPETSCTGFFTYALWWGINNKILDKNVYLPMATAGWNALVKAVQPNGMLGWVQPIGSDPQLVTKDMTEVYGAGAFMRTGQEILKYLSIK